MDGQKLDGRRWMGRCVENRWRVRWESQTARWMRAGGWTGE